MDDTEIKIFVESALLAAGRPLNVAQLQDLFDGRSTPEKSQIRQAVSSLIDDYEGRGITIAEVTSGFRLQISASMADRLHKLWEDTHHDIREHCLRRWLWLPTGSPSHVARLKLCAVYR